MTARTGPRMVMVTPAVPEVAPEHAGGKLLRDVVTALDPDVHLTVVVPQGPSVRRAHAHPRIDALVVIDPGHGCGESSLERLVGRYVLTGAAPRWFVHGIANSPPACQAVARAQVVDLQWQEQAVLVPWVREVNPGARVTVVLHDVLSQSAQRAGEAVTGTALRSWLLGRRWAWARRRALTAQARLTGADPGTGTPDAVAVLSDKDARLLRPGSVPVTVVPPPLGAAYAHVDRAPATCPPELLMVAFMARWANEDALRWFAAEVLPRVREVHPDVRVRVAGAGLRPGVEELARENGIDLLGFVPDLNEAYRTATAVVVPLRLGAGLKFKVVEALSAGVPVVTTPVGAEGVGPEEWFAGVASDAGGFAQALLDVLAGQPAARERARAARVGVAAVYGDGGFRQALGRVYGPGTCSSLEGDSVSPGPEPEVSVVIPAHNAAATIGAQLESLSRQVAAPPFEVVVADNRSTDGTADTARARASALPCGLRVVPAHARRGASHARNRGAAESRGALLLFCDADDRVDPNWVGEMSRALEHTCAVGSDVVPFVETEPQPRAPALRPIAGTNPRRDYVLSCALGVRRDVWTLLGGFDEAYEKSHEEVDLCCRLHLSGLSLGAVPTTCVHYRLRSTDRGVLRQYWDYATGSMLLWTRFNGRVFDQPVSFTRSVPQALRATVRLLGRRAGPDRWAGARDCGWAWGIVAGHVRYRVLGRPPAPRLWPTR